MLRLYKLTVPRHKSREFCRGMYKTSRRNRLEQWRQQLGKFREHTITLLTISDLAPRPGCPKTSREFLQYLLCYFIHLDGIVKTTHIAHPFLGCPLFPWHFLTVYGWDLFGYFGRFIVKWMETKVVAICWQSELG